MIIKYLLFLKFWLYSTGVINIYIYFVLCPLFSALVQGSRGFIPLQISLYIQ